MPERNVIDQLALEWDQALKRLGEHLEGPRPGPPGPAALFAELEDVRLACDELRSSIPLVEYAGRYVTTSWTLKDLLAHMASWATEFHREVRTLAGGEKFDYAIPLAGSVIGPTQWNQTEVDRRTRRSLNKILDEFDSETRALQDFILALPLETLHAEAPLPLAPSGDPSSVWHGSIARVVGMKCMHDRYHIDRIRQWSAML